MMHPTTQRLYQAAAELHHIQQPADLAHFLKLSHQTLRNWEQKGVSKKGLQEAPIALGISPEWLATGQGEMHIATPSTSPPTASPNLPTPDLFTHARQRLSLPSEHINHAIVQDDNMSPTLERGDTILIDERIRQYDGAGLYCVATAQGTIVYRIKAFANGMMMLINDNPAYPPELLRPEEMQNLSITGRIVGKYGIVAL